MDDYQGLIIDVTTDDLEGEDEIQINGQLSIFVNPGSQYAIWSQFPDSVLYTLKDLDNGETYESHDTELSISWDGNGVYDMYSDRPCNRIITEEFSTLLTDINFRNPPKTPLVNFELQASYLGHSSNSVTINNASVSLSSP